MYIFISLKSGRLELLASIVEYIEALDNVADCIQPLPESFVIT